MPWEELYYPSGPEDLIIFFGKSEISVSFERASAREAGIGENISDLEVKGRISPFIFSGDQRF